MDETGRHSAEFVTPAGMRYRSGAPPPPGPFDVFISQVEARIIVALGDLHAA